MIQRQRLFNFQNRQSGIAYWRLIPVAYTAILIVTVLVLALTERNASAQSGSVASDRAALTALYENTDGPNWENNTNWLNAGPLDDWYGVNTNAEGRVVSLYLKGPEFIPGDLKGYIPSQLGDLTELTSLILGFNELQGSIPLELGNLTNLTQLDLQGNQLEGLIPAEIGNLTKLVSLNLADNQLTGDFPDAIASLTNLSTLNLGRNQLTGKLEGKLANLTKLRNLVLEDNFFRGHLPNELTHLTRLQRLMLGNNHFSGHIPDRIGNLNNLHYLNLSDNNLTGNVPSSIGELSQLYLLVLHSNRLTGSLPKEIGNLLNLQELYVSRNELSGRITPQIAKLTNLIQLDLSNNQLSGPVISGLRRLPNLQILYLHNNDLSGPLHTRFVDAPILRYLSIQGNEVCLPGTQSFRIWLRRVIVFEFAHLIFCNAADRRTLEQLYATTNGDSWLRRKNWNDDTISIERWDGVETDDQGRVISLDLSHNGLKGILPSGLGEMSQLKILKLEGNELSGRLPLSIRRLTLNEFHFEDTQLCVPTEMEYPTWLEESVSSKGTGVVCDPLSEQQVLSILFESTGGSDWIHPVNWDTKNSLSDWNFIELNEDERVVALNLEAQNLTGSIPIEITLLTQLHTLNLANNSLTGPIPPELGNLSHLTSLNLDGNRLFGTIPSTLGKLQNLTQLSLRHNDVHGNIPADFINLPSLTHLDLSFNLFSGAIPDELADLANLEVLMLRGNGFTGHIPAGFSNFAKLRVLDLSVNLLRGELPAELNSLSSLEHLRLADNLYTGEIPTELGSLKNLLGLDLTYNFLTGEIPKELGELANLKQLDLSINELVGEIPVEIGHLTQLEELNLTWNHLTGTIPDSIGNQRKLKSLDLSRNQLSGAIPSKLGDMDQLTDLLLYDNQLSGNLPQEIGNLSQLETILLYDNKLSGSIPSTWGNLTMLRSFSLSNNSDLTGPVPIELTALENIESFLTGGTSICLPSEPELIEWIKRVYKRRVLSCDADGPLLAYLINPVQSHDYPVPLVAGEPALLRAFPQKRGSYITSHPRVRARLFLNEQEIYQAELAEEKLEAGITVDEGSLSSSVNIPIPGSVIQPGLQFIVEVLVEGNALADSDLNYSIPETGRLGVEVFELPEFHLTLIPYVLEGSNDDSIVATVNEMAANPRGHPLLEATRNLLPIAELSVVAHEPVLTSTDSPFDLLNQTRATRVLEDGEGYYLGLMSEAGGYVAGVAYAPGRDSFSIPDSRVIAHELGHNLSLFHAPCGGPFGVDSSFPDSDGLLGSWGYDINEESLVGPSTPDLMSYCEPPWISEYHFSNALRYRLFIEEEAQEPVAVASESLLVWGGQNSNGVVSLNPTFLVDAPPSRPSTEGDYKINVWSANGEVLFSMRFDMQNIEDMEGDKSFLFTIPIDQSWEDELVSISVDDETGQLAHDMDNTNAMTLLRNPVTRQVRGFLSYPSGDTQERDRILRENNMSRGLEVQNSRMVQ